MERGIAKGIWKGASVYQCLEPDLPHDGNIGLVALDLELRLVFRGGSSVPLLGAIRLVDPRGSASSAAGLRIRADAIAF